jgi:hypothetical protein
MREAFMSITKVFRDFEGYDACRSERSTWASWRM